MSQEIHQLKQRLVSQTKVAKENFEQSTRKSLEPTFKACLERLEFCLNNPTSEQLIKGCVYWDSHIYGPSLEECRRRINLVRKMLGDHFYPDFTVELKINGEYETNNSIYYRFIVKWIDD